ncbi:hypothetical protein M438DRAFT_340610 [Aureobasidium pullulans EXF-150]|uniref:Uncharacterized protein n=1 Tax=Aureobasidium pullulans EXF-150 TaxID=1043002 RepID=A0A074X8T8_AURPU|nr:uncharacterized protein M438DRAFT_340610 [Aureobasidium pullulans EXF-150]KEQ78482.1 hypothetical protein M438DRAFT_340610 [Aureobasidium pullulans EXF-150]
MSFQDQTSSTRYQSSPHIRPTVFTRGSKLKKEDVSMVRHVQEMMEILPDQLVREILNAPGMQNLLAKQQEAEQAEIPSGSDGVAVTKVEQIVTVRMHRYVNDCLGQKIKEAFKSLVRQRLDRLVQDQLPLAANLFLNGAVEGYRDQFYEDCKMNEASLLKMVDEGRTQLQDTANECTTEIKDLIQDQIDELESWSDKLKASVGEQLACLGYWSNEFARSNAKKMHAMKSTARCKSV